MTTLIRAFCCALGLFAVGSVAIAHPGGITTPDPNLPPEGVYLTPADVHATYGGGALTIVLNAIQHQPFRDLPPREICQPGLPACDEHHDFDSDMTGKVSINGGPRQTIDMAGRVQTVAYGKMLSATTGSWPTEMLAMTLQTPGPGPMGPPVMIRESPTLPSIGQTSIIPVSGGRYHIDSFFDVFTELSLDGGQTWIPSNGPTHVMVVPEPASFGLLALALIGFAGVVRRRK